MSIQNPWTAFVSFALVYLQVIPYRTVSWKAQVDSFKNKSLSKPSGKSDRLNYKQMQIIEKRGEKVKMKAKDWKDKLYFLFHAIVLLHHLQIIVWLEITVLLFCKSVTSNFRCN